MNEEYLIENLQKVFENDDLKFKEQNEKFIEEHGESEYIKQGAFSLAFALSIICKEIIGLKKNNFH